MPLAKISNNVESDELEHPVSDYPNGVSLDAMCRTIEIASAEAMGEEPLPPLQPINPEQLTQNN